MATLITVFTAPKYIITTDSSTQQYSSENMSTEPIIMPAETFEVYKDVLAAMIARYGTRFVQNLKGKTGFVMRWFSKWDALDAYIKVFITPDAVIRIEFSRNLGHGICNDVPSAKTEIELTGLGRVLLFNKPEEPFIYGLLSVRQSRYWFSKANSQRVIISLLEKFLQG